MKINITEDATSGNISFYFYENEEFCDKIKSIFGITIIPTLDKTAIDPRNNFKVVDMPKVMFGKYDHALVGHFDINSGDEPLSYIMINMFKGFVSSNGLKRGDIIIGYGIFELASMLDPLTLDAYKIFFMRGLINHELNEVYSKIREIDETVESQDILVVKQQLQTMVREIKETHLKGEMDVK